MSRIPLASVLFAVSLLFAGPGLATKKGSGPASKSPPPKAPSVPPADAMRAAPPGLPGTPVPATKGGKPGKKRKTLKTIPGTQPRGVELGEELIELDPLFELRPILRRLPPPRHFDPKKKKIVKVNPREDMWDFRKKVAESLEGAGDDPKEKASRLRYWADEYEREVKDIKKHGRREDKVVGIDTMEESARKLREAADRLDPPRPKPAPKPAGKQ